MMYLYRVGLHWTDHERRRYFVTQTIASTEPEVSQNQTLQGLLFFFEQMRYPFGGATDAVYGHCYPRYQRFWPTPGWTVGLNMTIAPNASHDLFSGAPEAAFRLQRVGAYGSRSIGRMSYPILASDWFTDPPHFRHVDVDRFNAELADGLNSHEQQYTYLGRTYVNVILTRRDMSIEPVVAFRVLENPVRLWRRSRPYYPAQHENPDVTYIPQQGLYL